MNVSELMSTEPISVKVEDTLAHAAMQMKEQDIGFLLVLTGKNPTGVVTDRDMVVRGIAAGRDPVTSKVKEVMTKGVIACDIYTTVRKAADLMKKEKVGRLVVADSANQPVGIISLGDLATRTQDKELVGDILTEIKDDLLVKSNAYHTRGRSGGTCWSDRGRN